MSHWKRAPSTLWVYVTFMLIGTILIDVSVHTPFAARTLFSILMLSWAFFLLKGIRWLWIATVALSALGFIPEVLSGSVTWKGTFLGLIGLILLLLPVTRRFFLDRATKARA